MVRATKKRIPVLVRGPDDDGGSAQHTSADELLKKTWRIPKSLARELAIHCAKNGVSQETVVAAGIRRVLGEEE